MGKTARPQFSWQRIHQEFNDSKIKMKNPEERTEHVGIGHSCRDQRDYRIDCKFQGHPSFTIWPHEPSSRRSDAVLELNRGNEWHSERLSIYLEGHSKLSSGAQLPKWTVGNGVPHSPIKWYS